MKKKTIKIIIIVSLIMFFGWIGNLFFGRYLTPTLIKSKIFSRLEIFSNDNKNTTIINKTEKVVVREDESIGELASSAVYAVVEVLSFEKNQTAVDNRKSISLEKRMTYSSGKSGTGTILTNDGIIVTPKINIIEENADYKIIAPGGNILNASLLGVDNFTELAYLRVEGVNLTTIPFASSARDINFGKKVILIGGLSGVQKNYLAEGIVNGFDEDFNLAGGEVASSEKLEGILDIDFKEDDKYVGGPVINYSGELVALTTKIEIGGKEKYFQIPIEFLKDSMQKIVENKIEQSAKLGVYYISVNPFYKNLLEISKDSGALIHSASGKQGLAIIDDSAAQRAGLKINDLIVSIDGNEINPRNPLSNFINQYGVGDSATLNVVRDGKEIEVTVQF